MGVTDRRATRLDCMAEIEQAIGNDDLTVTVEMGDGFTPGVRTAAALQELVEALHDEHGDDVAGFSGDKPEALRNFSFGFSPEPSRNFYEAWPSKWVKAGFDGKGNDQ